MPVSNDDLRPDDWDRHWNDLEESALVNPAQEYRRHIVLANLGLQSVKLPRVLDIGSGLGDFLVDLHALHPDIPKLGLEMSSKGVKIGTRRLPQARFLQRDLIVGDEDPAEYREFATHAVCSEVLEHVDDPVRLLRNARAYMAEGCRLVVTVPGGPRSDFDIHIGHRRHFKPADLEKILKESGFTVEFATGAGFPFFNIYRLVVIMRGTQLIDDASGKPSMLLRAVSFVFRLLFKFNISRSPFGWQTLAVATK